MTTSRIIVSANVAGHTHGAQVDFHHKLLNRLDGTGHSLSLAIGMFEGKEELSVVMDMDNVPFIVVAATAHDLCRKFGQQSVYFAKGGRAYLATASGEMIPLGRERVGVMHPAECPRKTIPASSELTHTYGRRRMND